MSRKQSASLGSALIVSLSALLGTPTLATQDSGWYLEATLGRTSFEATLGSRWPKWFDDEDRAAGLEVGRALNRYFAIQGGFVDLGDYQGHGSPCPEDAESCIELLATLPGYEDSEALALCAEGRECLLVAVPIEAEIQGWSLSLVPQLPIGERFSLYGKLGVIDWEAELFHHLEISRRNRIDSFSDQQLLTALGARCDLPGRFAVLAEYRRLDLDLDSASLGLRWRF